MRNNILLLVCFLLVVVNAYADQTLNGRQPREWDQAQSSVKLQSGGTDYTDNTSVFANLVVTGNQATGNPGYLGMMATDNKGVSHTYYLWVDASNAGIGVLEMSSFASLSTMGASWPYGDWRKSGPGNIFLAGVKVSSQ